MVELSGRLSYRGDDFGMGMAKDRAHLPRREVEHAVAAGVVQIAAARADGHEAREITAKAKKMSIGTCLKSTAYTMGMVHEAPLLTVCPVVTAGGGELLSGQLSGRPQRICQRGEKIAFYEGRFSVRAG